MRNVLNNLMKNILSISMRDIFNILMRNMLNTLIQVQAELMANFYDTKRIDFVFKKY